MTKKTKSMWRFEKERKRILFIISGAFFILFISLIANKLFNFPRLILNHLFPSLDNEWIYLITNLLLVTFAAVITIAIILHKQGEALKEIEVLPKVESELSHNFLNELPLFFIVINVDGTTRYINQLLLDALGYQEEEILGKDFLKQSVPPQHRGMLKDKFFSSNRRDKPSYGDNIVLTKDGKELWTRWYVQPVYDNNDNLKYLNCIGIVCVQYICNIAGSLLFINLLQYSIGVKRFKLLWGR